MERRARLGFIEAEGGRLFVHISSIERLAGRPRVGNVLTFERGVGTGGRPAAIRAEIRGANPLTATPERGRPPPPMGLPSIGRLVGAVAQICTAVLVGAPAWMLALNHPPALSASPPTGLTRSAAESGNWRISEATLHIIDFLGGLAGRLAAQALLRHKPASPPSASSPSGSSRFTSPALLRSPPA